MATAVVEADVECPCCRNQTTIQVVVGDAPPTDPHQAIREPDPPHLIDQTGCRCWEYLDRLGHIEGYDDEIMERLGEMGVRLHE